MSDIFDKKLPCLKLLGGEPLLNPEFNEYVKYSRECFPKTSIEISTNATLLDDMDENFWKTLNEYDAHIIPTVYPIKINWESILNKAQKYDVKMFNDSPTNDRLTMDNVEAYHKTIFFKTTLKHNNPSRVDKSACTIRKGHFDMYGGKLYPCFNIAYVRHLNKKFNTDFKVSQKDYLDLYKISSLKEVKEFSNTDTFPFCNYCSCNFEPVEWGVAKEHSIKEWT